MPEGGGEAGTRSFVELLRQPGCYPHPVGPVELLETHISWVLLAGEFAYKVKKPVSLGFVDFSTLAIAPLLLRGGAAPEPPHRPRHLPRGGAHHRHARGAGHRRHGPRVRVRREDAPLPAGGAAGPRGEGGQAHRRAGRGLRARRGRLPRARGAARAVEGAFGAPAEILAEAVDNFTQIELLDDREDTRAVRQALLLVDASRVQPPRAPCSRGASTTASCASATATCTWATWRWSTASRCPSTPSSSTRPSAGST